MTIHDIIYKLYPEIRIIEDDGLKAFDADHNPVEYDMGLVQAEFAKVSYFAQREKEYPSFADQFDLLYHGGYDAWYAAIDAIKQKYPKPGA